MKLRKVVLELGRLHQRRVKGRSQSCGVQRLPDEHYLPNLQPKSLNPISLRSPRRCLVCSGGDEGRAVGSALITQCALSLRKLSALL
jgi:hypothetical protein